MRSFVIRVAIVLLPDLLVEISAAAAVATVDVEDLTKFKSSTVDSSIQHP